MSVERERRGEIHRGRRLTNATLLIRNRDDPTHHPTPQTSEAEATPLPATTLAVYHRRTRR